MKFIHLSKIIVLSILQPAILAQQRGMIRGMKSQQLTEGGGTSSNNLPRKLSMTSMSTERSDDMGDANNNNNLSCRYTGEDPADYEFIVDCNHPDSEQVFDTDTNSQVLVEIYADRNVHNLVERRQLTGLCRQNNNAGSSGYTELIRVSNTSCAVDNLSLYIFDDDAVFIDRVTLFKNGNQIFEWGRDGGDGLCLSTDPDDHNQGSIDWTDHVSSSIFGGRCVSSMFFEFDGFARTGDF